MSLLWVQSSLSCIKGYAVWWEMSLTRNPYPYGLMSLDLIIKEGFGSCNFWGTCCALKCHDFDLETLSLAKVKWWEKYYAGSIALSFVPPAKYVTLDKLLHLPRPHFPPLFQEMLLNQATCTIPSTSQVLQFNMVSNGSCYGYFYVYTWRSYSIQLLT